jgi:hypothetical protein
VQVNHILPVPATSLQEHQIGKLCRGREKKSIPLQFHELQSFHFQECVMVRRGLEPTIQKARIR